MATWRRAFPNRLDPAMPFVPAGSEATYLRGRGAAPLGGGDLQRSIQEELLPTEPSGSCGGLEDSFSSPGGERGADVLAP